MSPKAFQSIPWWKSPLNSLKNQILALLSANPHATTADLIEETGLSVSGVEKNIRELKAAGRLRRVGPDKGGHWEVVGFEP